MKTGIVHVILVAHAALRATQFDAAAAAYPPIAFDGAAGPDALNGLWLKWCVRNYHGRWFRLGRALLAPSSYGSLAKSAGLLTR